MDLSVKVTLNSVDCTLNQYVIQHKMTLYVHEIYATIYIKEE